MNNSLANFLDDKGLFYDKIDYDIIYKSWEILKQHVKLPYIVHIVGTNGKGTTGRYLASFLDQLQQEVIHYTSPHISKFNERIWINGDDISDDDLTFIHKNLQNILPEKLLEVLTYFEYTTLMALYFSSDMDYLILEAGLGGEFDATNVVKSDLSIFTTIDLDHQEFLGDTISEIAATKMRSCNNTFILGNQINQEVIDVKNDILSDFKEIIYQNDITLPKGYEALPLYLIDNLKLSLNVLDYLDLDIANLRINSMQWRFQKISNNIIVDVGHNPLAATVICKELLKENKKVILIYNSYKDKDFKKVLTILKPIIKQIEIIECFDIRMVDKDILMNCIESFQIDVKDFDINNMSDDNYLVFGSFLVAENFLKLYNKL
jgi:dihydrofolate synthase/folylpolyglutamate synthase